MRNLQKVSVCMATYNGEKYIEEQVASILKQLCPGDEFLIVDDASVDGTLDLIEKFHDFRIRVIKLNSNVGHVNAFGKAILEAAGDIIFLSDQDDVWLPNRLNIMIDAFDSHTINLVCSNFSLMNISGKTINNPITPLKEKFDRKYVLNILAILLGRRSYYGCGMAFRRCFISQCFPIPKYVEAHDVWFALAGNINKTIKHLNIQTLKHRIHEFNVTKNRRSLNKVIYSRMLMLMSVANLLIRLIRK